MAESHEVRSGRLARQFDEAMARFLTRVEGAGPEAERAPGEGWSVAQIAWHVAKVTDSFAGLMTGRIPGVEPAPAGFVEKAWPEIVAGLPRTLTASGPSVPPAGVTAPDAVERLRASAGAMRHAIANLSPGRGAGFILRTPITGAISVYQIAEWGTAHVIRHNAQAKRVLGR